MGATVTFPSNGHLCGGFLAAPGEGRKGPAVVVIQEWWGLVPHIQDVADRFAAEGFLALAPDLYHGRTAASPDDAAKMLMELDVERAVGEIVGAGRWLLAHGSCSSAAFGVVGFCMGGALAQVVATRSPEVGAAASFYGGFRKVTPDWERLAAPLLLVYGGADQGVPAADGQALASRLRGMGKAVELAVYPGAGHAFFNDSRPAVHDPVAAGDAWRRTLSLFRSHLA